jgi:dCTP deaminase
MEIPTSPHERTLVDADLRALIALGSLTCVGASDGLDEFVQPASIDIPVGNTAYLVKGTFLPFRQRVRALLPEMTLETRDLRGDGAVLLKGQTYLIYIGRVDLPPGHRGCLSPKSSIGRIDLMVRCLVDGCGLYDTVPAHAAGGAGPGTVAGGGRVSPVEDEEPGRELWVEVSPRSFNIRLRCGSPLTQMMVLRDLRFAATEEAAAAAAAAAVAAPAKKVPVSVVFDAHGAPLTPSWYKSCLVLSLRVPTTPGVLVGFEAVATHDVIDLGLIAGHSASRYFRPLIVDESDETHTMGRLTLVKDRFYILCTKERVAVRHTIIFTLVLALFHPLTF